MNKPLKDWTLGEIAAECEKHKQGCEPCPFYHVLDDVSFSSNCKARQLVNKCPDDWDLSESPRWTEQDKEDAKAIVRVFGNKGFVERDGSGKLELNSCYYINRELFPSLKPGESTTLDEIIGGAK